MFNSYRRLNSMWRSQVELQEGDSTKLLSYVRIVSNVPVELTQKILRLNFFDLSRWMGNQEFMSFLKFLPFLCSNYKLSVVSSLFRNDVIEFPCTAEFEVFGEHYSIIFLEHPDITEILKSLRISNLTGIVFYRGLNMGMSDMIATLLKFNPEQVTLRYNDDHIAAFPTDFLFKVTDVYTSELSDLKLRSSLLPKLRTAHISISQDDIPPCIECLEILADSTSNFRLVIALIRCSDREPEFRKLTSFFKSHKSNVAFEYGREFEFETDLGDQFFENYSQFVGTFLNLRQCSENFNPKSLNQLIGIKNLKFSGISVVDNIKPLNDSITVLTLEAAPVFDNAPSQTIFNCDFSHMPKLKELCLTGITDDFEMLSTIPETVTHLYMGSLSFSSTTGYKQFIVPRQIKFLFLNSKMLNFYDFSNLKDLKFLKLNMTEVSDMHLSWYLSKSNLPQTFERLVIYYGRFEEWGISQTLIDLTGICRESLDIFFDFAEGFPTYVTLNITDSAWDDAIKGMDVINYISKVFHIESDSIDRLRLILLNPGRCTAFVPRFPSNPVSVYQSNKDDLHFPDYYFSESTPPLKLKSHNDIERFVYCQNFHDY